MALLNAASASNAAFGKQSAAVLPSLAPHDSKARLISVTTCRRFMAKPCTPHPIAQRVQFFKLQTRNVGGRGALPSRSLGGPRGPFSHVREWPPFPHSLRRAGNPIAAFRQQWPVKHYCFNNLLISRSASAVTPSKSTQGWYAFSSASCAFLASDSAPTASSKSDASTRRVKRSFAFCARVSFSSAIASRRRRR